MLCEQAGSPGLCPLSHSWVAPGGPGAAAHSVCQLRAVEDFGEERAASQTESDSSELNQTNTARFGTETPRASLQSVTRDLVTKAENGPGEAILIYAEGSHLRS